MEENLLEPVVYIIGEDDERMRDLLEALDDRNIPTVVWNTSHGALVPTDVPGPGVYYSRQSPSAASRGHPYSVAYTKVLLRWLEFRGAQVINGSKALDVEASKCLQMMVLDSVELNTPYTMMCEGLVQTTIETKPLSVPLIIKPDTGGSGKGIETYASGKDAAYALRHSINSMRALAPDNLWIIQRLLGEYSNDMTVMRSIIRLEIIGGQVQRDYVVKITAPSKVFSLCPCDPRSEALLKNMSFMIIKNPLTIPGFIDDVGAWDRFCKKIEKAFELCDARIGSVEAMVLAKDYPVQQSEYPSKNEPVIIDMNFNTNYNKLAEAAAGIKPGVERVVDVLEEKYLALLDSGRTGPR